MVAPYETCYVAWYAVDEYWGILDEGIKLKQEQMAFLQHHLSMLLDGILLSRIDFSTTK